MTTNSLVLNKRKISFLAHYIEYTRKFFLGNLNIWECCAKGLLIIMRAYSY